METVNKKEFSERMQKVLDHHGDNANQLAAKIGKTNVGIYRMLDPTNDQLPTMKTIVAVLKVYPLVDYRWLLSGDGTMVSKQAKPAKNLNDFRELLDVVARLIPDNNELQWATLRGSVEDSYLYIVDQMVMMHGQVAHSLGEVQYMKRQISESKQKSD